MFGKKKNKKEGEGLPLAPARKRSSATPSPRGSAPKTPVPSTSEFLYISNEAHYDQVIERIKSVKKTLWIGTADIKDLYVKDGRGTKPLLEVLSDLAKRGVEIRLIHAKEPGPAFRQDFDKYPALIEGMERVLVSAN